MGEDFGGKRECRIDAVDNWFEELDNSHYWDGWIKIEHQYDTLSVGNFKK